MELLPSFDARERLLDALAVVGGRVGWDTFVAGPILTPEPKWFPQTWSPDRRGVRRLLRSMLAYAELSYEISVEVDQPPEDGVVAWFSGLDETTCYFGIGPAELKREDNFVGALCHESAHAFRRHHGVELSNRDREEEATDLTSVFLGFGVLVLNASDQFDTSGELIGTMVRTHYHVRRLGYLSPLSLAYVLAVQAVVRDLPRSAIGELAGHLRTNQRASFEAALKELRGKREFLKDRLRLPASDTWPAPRTEPVSFVEEDIEPPSVEEPAAPSRPNAGRLALRIRHDASGRRAFHGTLLAAVVSVVLAKFDAGVVSVVAVVAGAGIGFVVGRRTREDTCAACGVGVAVELAACSRCGAEIVGETTSDDERLAFDDLAEQREREDALTAFAVIQAEGRKRRRRRLLKVALALGLIAAALAFIAGGID